MRCDLQIFSGCVCHLEQLHAQSPFLFPIVFWGELERAPHRRVGLGFCHSRFIYIGIGGPTAIFEPAPFLQPCTFFWPDLVDRKPPHQAAHNAHTDAQYKATEPRLLRAYRCKARFSPTSKKYMTSGRIGFLFSMGLARLQLQEKYSTRMNVNVVARSTLMRAFIAMHNAVVRSGYLQQST